MGKYNPIIFTDRKDGGKKLADSLKKLKLENPIVLAIPAGGVPVGKIVAQKLDCPFDLLIVRKIKHPLNPEAGIGSITAGGKIFLNKQSFLPLGLKQKEIANLAKETFEEIKLREKKFRQGKPKPDLKNKTIILVDDGLASGFTMLAAARSVKMQDPKKIIVAVPTASAGAVELLKEEVNQIISLYTHPLNKSFAVAYSYQYWHDLTDKEVMSLLKDLEE